MLALVPSDFRAGYISQQSDWVCHLKSRTISIKRDLKMRMTDEPSSTDTKGLFWLR